MCPLMMFDGGAKSVVRWFAAAEVSNTVAQADAEAVSARRGPREHPDRIVVGRWRFQSMVTSPTPSGCSRSQRRGERTP